MDMDDKVAGIIAKRVVAELEKIGDEMGIPLKPEAYQVTVSLNPIGIKLYWPDEIKHNLTIVLNEDLFPQIIRKWDDRERKGNTTFRFSDDTGGFIANTWEDLIDGVNSGLSDENLIHPGILGRGKSHG